MFRLEIRWLIFFGIIGLILLLDQGAKLLVMRNLSLGESWVFWPAISSFIKVTRSFNTGAAFGIFPSANAFFLFVALITMGVFTYLFYDMPDDAKLTIIGIAIVLGGAISNAIDRIRFQHVVDYVHVQLGPNFANISNFADHAVTIGVVLLLIDQWLLAKEEGKSENPPSREAVDNQLS